MAFKSPHYLTVRKTLDTLHGLEVPIPDHVATAVAELDRVEALKPDPGNTETLTAAYLDPKANRASIDQQAFAITANRLNLEAWTAARDNVAATVTRELTATVDHFIETVRPRAERCITELDWYAAEGSPDVARLVREGRVKDASRAAAIPEAHQELDILRGARKQLEGAKGLPWGKVGYWANPEILDTLDTANRLKNLQGLDYTLAGLVAGGRLWWPTTKDALKLLDKIERKEAADLDAARAREARRKARFI